VQIRRYCGRSDRTGFAGPFAGDGSGGSLLRDPGHVEDALVDPVGVAGITYCSRAAGGALRTAAGEIARPSETFRMGIVGAGKD
jgi:hypothetical protein